MKLKIKTLIGKEFEVDVELSDKVELLKLKILEKADIPPEEQTLIFCGKKLEDSKTLESYSIAADNAVHLIRIQDSKPGQGISVQGPPPVQQPMVLQGQPAPPGSAAIPGVIAPSPSPYRPPSSFIMPPPQQMPTTFCPYCTVQFAFPPGSRYVQCPMCHRMSELAPVMLKTIACGRCGSFLQYAPQYTLIKCSVCGVHVSTVPMAAPPGAGMLRPGPIPQAGVEDKRVVSFDQKGESVGPIQSGAASSLASSMSSMSLSSSASSESLPAPSSLSSSLSSPLVVSSTSASSSSSIAESQAVEAVGVAPVEAPKRKSSFTDSIRAVLGRKSSKGSINSVAPVDEGVPENEGGAGYMLMEEPGKKKYKKKDNVDYVQL